MPWPSPARPPAWCSWSHFKAHPPHPPPPLPCHAACCCHPRAPVHRCARVAIDEDEDERGQAGRADEGVAWRGVAWRGRAEEGEAATTGVEASRRLDAETWSD